MENILRIYYKRTISAVTHKLNVSGHILLWTFFLLWYLELINLKKLNEVEGKEQYCVDISNRFMVLENLDTEVDANKSWGTIRENIKISAKESLHYYELK
jgi:hypothetical protein